MDVVDCLLAEPALRELSVQAADLKPVDGLQPHHSASHSSRYSPRVSWLRSTYVSCARTGSSSVCVAAGLIVGTAGSIITQ